ncbi:MAG: hypothetical protein ACK4NY_09285 [Spirosomataceae bacterium]
MAFIFRCGSPEPAYLARTRASKSLRLRRMGDDARHGAKRHATSRKLQHPERKRAKKPRLPETVTGPPR